MRADVVALQHVKETVGPPGEPMQLVVRVLCSESRKDHPARIGLAIPIAVLQVEELASLGDVYASVTRCHAGRYMEAFGEHSPPVGSTVSVTVLQNQDLVGRRPFRLDLGIEFATRDPQAPLRIEVYLHRFKDGRIAGEEADAKSLVDPELCQFSLDIGRRHRLEVSLAQS